MSVVGRGTKNAFRNTIRSVSITAILALSIALALVMLLSLRAVQARIDEVKGSVGNTITITPAGARGFQGGGEPLTTEDVETVSSSTHVVGTTATLTGRASTTGSTTVAGPGGANTNANATTNLVSSIDPGTLGGRNGGTGTTGGTGGANLPAGFSLPITFTGTTDPASTQVSGVSQFSLLEGKVIDGSGTADVALVGTSLATKNSLKVGSTFTAYGRTLTVAGIYDTGNTFTNGGVIVPLATQQAMSGQTGEVGAIIATVDSADNLEAATTSIQDTLGTSADVVSDSVDAADTLASLDSVKTISLYSLVGALVAGAVIIFLSMMMIVRERRREIGVLKAIGSSNSKISFQFVVEALTLTVMGALVGIVIGIALSNPVLDVLVSSNTQTAATTQVVVGPGGGGPGLQSGQNANRPNGAAGPPANFRGLGQNVGQGVTRFGDSLSNLRASIGLDLLLYGLLAAILVAVVGSAIPAWLIARIRPAEVMRTE